MTHHTTTAVAPPHTARLSLTGYLGLLLWAMPRPGLSREKNTGPSYRGGVPGRGFCRHWLHAHHTRHVTACTLASSPPPFLITSSLPFPLLNFQGAISSSHGWLLHPVVHSFSFYPTPLALFTPPFPVVIKQRYSLLKQTLKLQRLTSEPQVS